MAHFARLDENNNVLIVVKIDDSCCVDSNGTESEAVGIAFCQSLYGTDTIWLQTSINKNIRKNFATVGGRYDPDLDAFIRPQIFPSWTLNPETAEWEPPVPRPQTDEWVIWVEPLQQWFLSEDLVGIDANAPGSIYHENHTSNP